eukprot:4507480-Amphidinium_carterae.1
MGTVKERARLTLEDLETMLSSTIPLGHRFRCKEIKWTPPPDPALASKDFPNPGNNGTMTTCR